MNRLKPFTLVLLVLLGLIVVLSLAAPLLFPGDHNTANLKARLLAPGAPSTSGTFVLGTDHLGRDFCARLFFAVRTTFSVALAGLALSMVIGVAVGLLAGWLGGWVDRVCLFVVDTLIAVPFTVITIVASAFLKPNAGTIILIFGVFGWAVFARLTRGQVMQVKEMAFIEGSRALGAHPFRIVFEHVLVNVSSILIVRATLSMGSFVLTESSISFLGLGIQPPDVSLGLMISLGRNYLLNQWWLSLIPSVIVVLIVLIFSLLGDWLRDNLDPKLKGR